ncbi:MAG: hypothetical protein ABI600_18160 [Luteolibacter sp.]
MEETTDTNPNPDREIRQKPLKAGSKEELVKKAREQGRKGHTLCHFTSAQQAGGMPYFTWTLFDPEVPTEETIKKSHGYFDGSELHPIVRVRPDSSDS